MKEENKIGHGVRKMKQRRKNLKKERIETKRPGWN
jgi:hypothetical protein